MTLKRLASALRRQDWAAAAIEVAIVVRGTFLGLEVSDWNAERRTARGAAVLLQSVAAEFAEFEARLAISMENRLIEVHWTPNLENQSNHALARPAPRVARTPTPARRQSPGHPHRPRR